MIFLITMSAWGAVKIGFVSQVFDGIAPEALNSVGLVSHHLAHDLARNHDVVMYGSAGVPGNSSAPTEDAQVTYRIERASLADRAADRAWPVLGKVGEVLRHGLRPPQSSSALVGRQYARAVADDVSHQHFDIVHVAHATQYLPVLRRAAPGAKIVLHAHAEWFPQTPSALLARRLAAADAAVGCSHYVTRRLVEYVPSLAGRCFAVTNGVSIRQLMERAPQAKPPTTSPFVLYVGGLSPQKGVHDLVAAFVEVARQVPDVELRVVGPVGIYPLEECFDLSDRELVRRMTPLYRGDYLERLKAMVPDDIAHRVVFTGRIGPTELLDHYLTASVLAFPSVWPEGFGLPPVEAMAAGVPVVATRIGALTETIIDGQTGFLVEPGDQAALADRLIRLLSDDDLRAKMGEAGADRARGTYDWPLVADELRRVYDRL